MTSRTLNNPSRGFIEKQVEMLIGYLDWLDIATEDLEPDLGSPSPHENRSQIAWAIGGSDDREQDADREPSLGQPECHGIQAVWGAGCDDDREI